MIERELTVHEFDGLGEGTTHKLDRFLKYRSCWGDVEFFDKRRLFEHHFFLQDSIQESRELLRFHSTMSYSKALLNVADKSESPKVILLKSNYKNRSDSHS